MVSVCFKDKPSNITVLHVYAPSSNAEEAEMELSYEDLQDLLELTQKRNVHFIVADWNAKAEHQEIPGIKANLAMEYQMKQGTGNRVLPKECNGHSKHLFFQTQKKRLYTHHQMANIKIRLIIFFGTKDRQALFSQQKQDWELTVARVMNFLT